MHLVLYINSIHVTRSTDNYSDRLRVCDLGSRARRSAPQRPFRARRSSPGFDSSAFRFTVNRRTRRSPIARVPRWQLADARPCRLWPWDLGRWEYSLRFGTPGCECHGECTRLPVLFHIMFNRGVGPARARLPHDA